MNRKYQITNAILWSSAIIASAIVHAPQILSLYLLPSLAACSFIVLRDCGCRSAQNHG